jgi:hypothetical protein
VSAKRLSIGQLQIYFDEQGSALFADVVQKRDRAAIETALLAEYRDFIDRWLDAIGGDATEAYIRRRGYISENPQRVRSRSRKNPPFQNRFSSRPLLRKLLRTLGAIPEPVAHSNLGKCPRSYLHAMTHYQFVAL